MRKSRIDEAIGKQVRMRAAVRGALDRHRVIVSRQTFGEDGVITRVLVAGDYYDVDERDLKLLRAGTTPKELELHPVDDEAAAGQ